MKILFLTNMWPIKEHPYFGIHVKEQIEDLEKYSNVVPDIFFINGRKNILNYVLSIFIINYKLITKKYDLIHIHYGLSGLFLLVNPFIKIPKIITLHGGDIDIHNSTRLKVFLTKMITRKCDKIIILNDYMRSVLNKQKEKLIIIPCAVNTVLFNPHKVKRKGYSLVFPGNPERKVKNFALFKRVVGLLKKTYPNIEIDIIHNKSRQEVVDVLNKADCLIMTSISEGSPQIIKEAMACNTPVVSTTVGDVAFLLEGVENSYYVSSFDENEISTKVLRILSNRCRSNGREKINTIGIDSAFVSKRIMNVYGSLLK